MQNWKIKKMTENEIKEWLRKINELTLHYEGKKRVDHCPLCLNVNCDNCLWSIIEEMACDEYSIKLYGHDDPVVLREDLRNKKWRNARLTQLPQWKKTLKAELKRRAELGA